MHVSVCACVYYVFSFPLPPPISPSLSISSSLSLFPFLLSLLYYIPPLSLVHYLLVYTNGPDTCHYILEDCKSNIIIIENQKKLDKILQVRKIALQEYIINIPNKNAGVRSPSSLEGYCAVQGKAESGLRECL